MTPEALTEFLHAEIPLTAAMSLRVLHCASGEVEIGAPLAPNRNLHGTAFAGSLATLGLVCGWTLIHRGLADAGLAAHLVAQNNECQFLAPATAELRGRARLAPEEWARFTETLRSKGRARLKLVTEIHAAGLLAVNCTGTYAAKR